MGSRIICSAACVLQKTNRQAGSSKCWMQYTGPSLSTANNVGHFHCGNSAKACVHDEQLSHTAFQTVFV